MTLRCKDGDLAVIVGELPGCEANIGRIVQVRGPVQWSEQCGNLLCWLIPIRPLEDDIDTVEIENLQLPQPATQIE